jgi:hypothetical protein
MCVRAIGSARSAQDGRRDVGSDGGGDDDDDVTTTT